MKRIHSSFFTLLFAALFFTEMNAAILTVSNDVNNPAQFTSIQVAHDSASVGDTLYVYGSATVYASVTISKELTLIGNGYAPLSTNNGNGFPTKILKISLNRNSGAGTNASNSTLIGIEITDEIEIYALSGANSINGITIDRCRLQRLENPFSVNDGWLVTNSELKSVILSNLTNTIFSNCIFTSSLQFNNVSNSVLVTQSLVLQSSPYINIYEGVVFQNNIFYGVDFSNLSQFSYCTFNNNMTFDDGTASPLPIGMNNNTGTGNIEDTDPLFATFDKMAGCGISCIDNEDYHLQGGSPAIGTGLGGNDLGIYGGNYPWPDASGYTGMPPIPGVTSFNIINSVVIPGEKVHFEAGAETRN